MGAKKKGLANRLAKMSDDERVRYLQHRADMEEEARRRKEQLISTFLKNKLKREDGFARLNVAKINQNWHQILRKFKCKEMKQNVEYVKEHTERLLNLKNRTIQNVLKELEEAEEQYTNNYQSHLIRIDNIIDFGNVSLEEMHEIYERDRSEIMEIAKTERIECLKNAHEEYNHLRTICYLQDLASKKDIRGEYEYYFKRSDDIIRENKIEFDEMRRLKEASLTALWRQVSRVLREYVERTDIKRAHLAELQSLDTESAVEIAKNEDLMKRQEIEFTKLEKEYAELLTNHNDELKLLENTLKLNKKESLNLKIQQKKELDLDDKQLIILTDESNRVLKYLNKKFDKSQKILQLMQACRKLETQKEKVLRFTETTNDELDDFVQNIKPPTRSSSASSSSSASIKIAKKTSSVATPDSAFKFFDSLKDLDNFWLNYNKVRIDCLEMKQEHKILLKENDELKAKIRFVLEEAAMTKIEARLNVNNDFYVREIRSAPVGKSKVKCRV